MLNQKYFSGVGNYLRAEVLYRLGIRPFEQARTILESLADKKVGESENKSLEGKTEKTKDAKEGKDFANSKAQKNEAKAKVKSEIKTENEGDDVDVKPDISHTSRNAVNT